MAVKFFRTFSDYDRQAAEARRRRAMADLLAQQVAEPTQYGPGPTPAAAPLVRGLQAFLAARAAKKAGEAEESVAATTARTGEQISNYLFGGGRQPKTAADLTEVTPTGRLGPQTAADLTEVTPEGAYIKPYEKDPAAAFRLALTPAGGAAMKGSPMLAALLAQQTEKPTPEEFGTTPVRTKDGAVLIGRQGTVRPLGVELAEEPVKPENKSSLAKLLSEREGLPPNSPLRAVYDQAIAKETRIAPGPRINVDTGLSRNQQFSNENTLRDEFLQQTGDFRTIRSAYNKIMSTADNGAGDMSLLYQYVKLLDPGSVVRESEFATAAASGSFGEQIQGAVQKLKSGARLASTLRDSFRAEAKNIYEQSLSSAQQTEQQYRNLATDYGLDPNRVIPNTSSRKVVEVDY